METTQKQNLNIEGHSFRNRNTSSDLSNLLTSMYDLMPLLCFSTSTPLRLLKIDRDTTCPRIRYRRRAMRCALDDELIRELKTHLEQQQQRQQQAVIEEDEEPATAAEILSYAALADAGRPDLVERVIAAGGYPAALESLGLEMTPDPPSLTPVQLAARRFASDEIEGRLALGVGREQRLEQPVKLGAVSDEEVPRREPPLDDVPQATEIVSPPSITTQKKPGEMFTLNGNERMGTLALIILAAAGHGRSSMELFNADSVNIIAGASNALLILHGLLAIYASLIEARRFGRAPVLWFVKVLMAGPAAFVELERLGKLERDT